MYIFTIFLAVAWYMTSNIETMPSSSQAIPLYTYFLGANLISLSLLCLSLCFTIACYYTDPDISSMSSWIRKKILEDGGELLGIKTTREVSAWRRDLSLARQHDNTLADYETLLGREEEENKRQQHLMDGDADSGRRCSLSSMVNVGDLPKTAELYGDVSSDEIFTPLQLRELHIQIEIMLEKMKEKEDSDWKSREWKLVTEILDKAFLYFFSTALFLTLFGSSVHILQLDGY